MVHRQVKADVAKEKARYLELQSEAEPWAPMRAERDDLQFVLRGDMHDELEAGRQAFARAMGESRTSTNRLLAMGEQVPCAAVDRKPGGSQRWRFESGYSERVTVECTSATRKRKREKENAFSQREHSSKSL